MSSRFPCQPSVTYASETAWQNGIGNVFACDLSICIYIWIVLTFLCIRRNVNMHAGYVWSTSCLGFTAHQPRLHFSILRLDVASEIRQLTDWGNSVIAVQKLALHLLNELRANYKCNLKFPAKNYFHPWYVRSFLYVFLLSFHLYQIRPILS